MTAFIVALAFHNVMLMIDIPYAYILAPLANRIPSLISQRGNFFLCVLCCKL